MRVDLKVVEYTQPYARMDAMCAEQEAQATERIQVRSALSNFMHQRGQELTMKPTGFSRIEKCRQALLAIDRRGWERSYHQRQFHDEFLRACVRVFWKTEPDGEFTRSHQKILEENGWTHLSQEILVSTPRRFGKTISVSMFAAAMIYSAPQVEVSIYSTCKRISQKLLRNISKFLDLIYVELEVAPYKIERMNMEEVVVRGPEGASDIRVVNSYPSKVSTFIGTQLALTHTANVLPAARTSRHTHTPLRRPQTGAPRGPHPLTVGAPMQHTPRDMACRKCLV